jgi:hypothetical protein
METPPRTAPAAQARWYPLVSARAEVPPAVREAASAVSAARPRAPPTCCTVLNAPEMTPASASVAPDMPSVVTAGRVSPPPMPNRTNTGSRSVR